MAKFKLKNSKLGKTIKREIVRAMLERGQSIDSAKFLPAAEGAEDRKYDDVEEILNIAYINREEVPLAMDIFKPANVEEGKELPVIVTIHGGGLTYGDRHISRPFCRLLAHKGFLVFSIEYRLAPRANVCQELDDVCAGLDLVGRKLVDFDVDYNRIYMAAESSGAYLALYVAAMKDSVKLQNAIGYEPSKMRFRALYLNCGMFYTNRNDPCGWTLSEQIYGDKKTDEDFLQYMNPEHPEILTNLPPIMLTTSRGDFMNLYSIMLCEALKKAGKTCKLMYYPERELAHAFMTCQVYHPRTIESIDKMIEWFGKVPKRAEKDPELEKKRKKLKTRLTNGNINKQGVWKYIREVAETDPAHLRSTAIIDCTREYTFEQMFEEWDKYARVFSAIGITGAERSRAAIAGTISAEPLFAFYGLNMTGACVSMMSYPDFLPGGKWKDMLKAEKITDLIISDIMVTPDLWRELEQAKEELGLKNIILLHSLLGGPCTGPAELIFNEFNHQALRQRKETVFMSDLIKEYADAPISYAKDDGDMLAVITHTSGTTKGTRKPLPYTNRSINNIATNYLRMIRERTNAKSLQGNTRVAPSFDLSSFLNLSGIVNGTLAAGSTVVMTFFGFLHPKFVRAIKYYKLNLIFSSGFMIDKWMQMDDDEIDFSSVKSFSCGGSYVSPEKLKKYNDFIHDHGCESDLILGYGMSETGGEDLAVKPGCDKDILGFPVNPNNYRIQDENDNEFYRIEDGARTGIMYVTSDSHCENTLDGEVLFEFTQIDGRDFVCTNDLIRVNDDGSLSYAGRADRYFVNNEGVRFDPGVTEVRIAAQQGILQCAVVPVLEKRIHDTVPVLYVIPEEKGEGAAEIIRKALVNVFVTEGTVSGSNMPTQFVIADDIPCNSNGKVDIYRITRDRLKGTAYNIIPVNDGDRLTDIRIEIVEQVSSINAGIVPDGVGGGNAMGLYDMLNTSADASASFDPFDPLGLPKYLFNTLKLRLNKKGNKQRKPPEKLVNTAQDFMGKLYGQKTFDHYFEM